MQNKTISQYFSFQVTLRIQYILPGIVKTFLRVSQTINDFCTIKVNSHALACVTRRLIGYRQKFATVYSAIYYRKSDVIT